jgi:hypothetical protein
MSSSSNLAYALAAMTALALGLSVSFWRSSAENKSLRRENLTAGIALEAAQDEAKVLREKLAREIKAREFAEAAQTVAETSERGTREKLIQETRAKRAAVAARQEAEAQLEMTAMKFAQEVKARNAAELAREQAVKTAGEMAAKLNEEVAARNTVQSALAEAEGQVDRLSAELAGEIEAREKAVTVKMQTVSLVAGSETVEEAKDGADSNAAVHSTPDAASLLQANDLSRRDLVIQ